ncbi:MAG: YfbK domain-containing protein, partial [Pirellulaceae bacterium]
DGDFNVGTTNVGQLVRLAETEARAGVFLTVLGFGMGNHNDAMLEELSNRANGNYAFIDTIDESRKVLGEQLQGTLVTIAKDVKIQVEFNPSHVSAYRLIGYENRRLAAQDFNDDRKDAGEIGAGHTVTALYELVPWGEGEPQLTTPVDPLKYQQRSASGAGGDELMTVKLRYKEPASDVSERLEVPVPNQPRLFSTASRDLQFAAAVAEFGMLLRHSPHCGNASYAGVLEIARGASQPDPYGYRSEFLQLVAAAQRLSGEPASQPFGSNWLPTPRSAQPITRLSVSPTVSAPAKSWDGFDVMLAGIAVLGGLCAFGASLSIVGVILWQARCAASP